MTERQPNQSEGHPSSGSTILVRTVLFMIVLPAAVIYLVKLLFG